MASSTESRRAELMRIIGAERDGQAPELVAFAEAEVARRLGGTRAQIRRRLRGAAALNVALGTGLLGVIGAVLIALCAGSLREEARAAEFPEVAIFCVSAAASVLAGAFFLIRGLAVLWGVGWMQRVVRFAPVTRPADAAALAAEPPVEHLIEVVGSARDKHSPDEVAAAEDELSARLSIATEAMVKRVRRWGAWAIAIGGVFAFQLCLMSVMITAAALRGEPVPLEAPPLPGQAGAVLCMVRLLAWVALGLALVISGVGLRR